METMIAYFLGLSILLTILAISSFHRSILVNREASTLLEQAKADRLAAQQNYKESIKAYLEAHQTREDANQVLARVNRYLEYQSLN